MTSISDEASLFAYLKKSGEVMLTDGVYLFSDHPTLVQLVHSDVDLSDFYLPNGAFTDSRFELISYITGDKIDGDSTPYAAPSGELPRSETGGRSTVDVVGDTWSNLPSLSSDYISRPDLEWELREVLLHEHHPLIALVGRGGIGKTWLALSVLHSLMESGRFSVVLWFSARDIDLLPTGPKVVRPDVLTIEDIASYFCQLVSPSDVFAGQVSPLECMANWLAKTPVGSVLYVFDNFETVRSPGDLFRWLDTHLRPPNKVLITSRHREFKGDYPIEVLGMTDEECDELVLATARQLNIEELITVEIMGSIREESGGHPYVVKVLLGEIASSALAKGPVRVARVVARRDDILDALFERTYAILSPAAKRIFLTLSGWRSVVPELALEAVLLRPANDRMDVSSAVDELHRFSFIESIVSDRDNSAFLSVPVAAADFGAKKLAVSPMKSAVEADLHQLFLFGATPSEGIALGLAPRVKQLVREVRARQATTKRRTAAEVEVMWRDRRDSHRGSVSVARGGTR